MMGRLLHLALPTASAALVRVLQLAILALLAQLSPAGSRDALVAGFGLISSFAMLTDSGAGNYLLSTPMDKLTRPVFKRALVLHLLLAVAGGLAAVGYLVFAAGGRIEPIALAVLIALAASLASDSACRIVRSPMLSARRDMAYSVPELALFVTKAPIVVVAVLSADITWLCLLPVPSLIILVLTAYASRRYVPGGDEAPAGIIRQILEFGWAGTLSASYSQAPLLIGTALLPLQQVAALAIAFRIVQALDFLPATVSLQLTPRVRSRSNGPLAYWFAFALPAAGIAAVLIASTPLVAAIVGASVVDPVVFVLVALSFGPKAGNYAVMAYMMGSGRIRARLVVTAVLSAFAFALSTLAASVFGLYALASALLIIEITFAIGCALAMSKPPRMATELA